jgi:hypothetical protein
MNARLEPADTETVVPVNTSNLPFPRPSSSRTSTKTRDTRRRGRIGRRSSCRRISIGSMRISTCELGVSMDKGGCSRTSLLIFVVLLSSRSLVSRPSITLPCTSTPLGSTFNTVPLTSSFVSVLEIPQRTSQERPPARDARLRQRRGSPPRQRLCAIRMGGRGVSCGTRLEHSVVCGETALCGIVAGDGFQRGLL